MRLLFIVLLFSFQQVDLEFEKVVESLKSKYTFICGNDWSIHEYSRSDSNIYYVIQREVSDTIIVCEINCRIISKSSFDIFLTNYYLAIKNGDYFKKQFYDQSNRLKYSYIENVNEDSISQFYYGKYLFLYENLLLNKCQVNYYLNNRDSLNSVAGNNLKKLPCIE